MQTGHRIQTFFNSMSTGGLAGFLRAVLLLILTALLIGGYAGARFRSFASPLSMELADGARQMATGRGAVTGVLRPFDQAWLRARGRTPAAGQELPPMTRHAPLYPRLLSYFIGASPAQDAYRPMPRDPAEIRIVLLGCLLTLLAVMFVFLAARDLFGPETGWVAGAVYLVSFAVLENAIAGHQGALVAALSASTLWLSVATVRRGAAGESFAAVTLSALGAGVLAGFGVGAAYVMLTVAVVLGVFVAIECRPVRAPGLPFFLSGVLVVLIPLFAILIIRTGSPFGTAPFGILNNTFRFAGHSLEATPEVDISLTGLMPALRIKFLSGLQVLLAGRMWHAAGGLLLAAFLIALFIRSERIGVQTLKFATLAGLGSVLAGSALQDGAPSADLGFAGLMPLIAVCAVGGMTELTDREDWFVTNAPAIARLALIALTALPTIAAVLTPARFPYPPYYPPVVAASARLVPPGEPLASDIPWALAWYGNRRAVLLPESIEALLALRRDMPDLRTLHLSTATGDRPFLTELRQGRHADWLPLLQGQAPEGFPFTNAVALPPGRFDHWILTEHPLDAILR